jgi:DNA-binding MarR family transcriptional regulator
MAGRRGSSDKPVNALRGHLLATLKYAQGASRTALEGEFTRLGITPQQFLALVAIAENADISNAELARHGYVSAQTMSALVGRLEAGGLIRRAPCPTGGRTLQTRITPAGAALLERATAHAYAIEQYVRDALGAPEFAALTRSLERFTEALAQAETVSTTTRPWAAYLHEAQAEIAERRPRP